MFSSETRKKYFDKEKNNSFIKNWVIKSIYKI